MLLSKAENEALANAVAKFRHDPYGFVMFAFPWGEGELKGENNDKPRKWQAKILKELGQQLRAGKINNYQAIQKAIASGHGIGKTALVSWLILWSMSTMQDTRGVVTANKEQQLRTKTWAELSKWHRLLICSHIFKFTATSLTSSDPAREKTWRFDCVTWSKENTEAFAGLHNKGKRIMLIFDEASAIPDEIWDVSEGALTDEGTEMIWCVFGNPTRNTGRFKECFGKLRHRWSPEQIDSRTVEGTNKAQFQKWIEDHKDDGGEDSDFVRVRVRGLFPRASALQLIPTDLVAEAQRREARYNVNDPLIMSLDIARGGDDECVFRFRRGLDAQSIPPVKVAGSEVKDSMKLVSKALMLIEEHHPDAFFYDGTGVGGPIGDRIKQLGHSVFEVQFGAASPDPKYANMRTYIYMKALEWLRRGGAIDADPKLETDLTSVEYGHDRMDRMILEKKEHMKERGLASPDDGDSFCMTFAFPVAPKSPNDDGDGGGHAKTEYDPHARAA